MFQSDSTTAGASLAIFARVDSVFGFDDFEIVEPSLFERSLDDHSHRFTVIDNKDLHNCFLSFSAG
jgi:hypothetical protein